MSKPKMSCPISSVNTVSRRRLLLLLLISCSYILSYGVEAADDSKLINIAAIIDVNSRLGKEEKVAMAIAVQNFNKISQNYNLSLHFRDSERDPHQAASAEALTREKEVMTVIIGTGTWEEAVLVADIGTQAKVPVISFTEPAITPPFTTTRWPFLVRMANNRAEQIKCTAALVGSYSWRRVIVVYEDDAISGNTGDLTLLSEALQNVGSNIEYRLVLPPFSYLTNPREFVREELDKILRTQSRVFIILQSSLPMVCHLFREAKEMGLVGTDSVWIITETITSLLDSFNASVISSMEGALGIKTYFSEYTSSYKDFKARFKKQFRSEYPEEDGSDPGIYALRAYDSIKIVAQGLVRMTSDDSSSEVLLENILSSNFTGLSGDMSFQGGKLWQTPTLKIINIQLGDKEKELYFWLPEFGFSKSLQIERVTREKNSSEVGVDAKDLDDAVIWPGNLSQRDPKGWEMPTNAKPLKIGVPARTSFEKFVRVEMSAENPDEIQYIDGFCIQLFYKLKRNLGYALPYEFIPYNGTYEDLVYHVYNKSYDAIVGDVTILASRSKLVEFTQPYAESGLSMIVPVYSEEAEWILMKPFTLGLWLVTGAILIYTIFVVWFLEHRINPEFSGPWNNQIATAIWFTFSSLFFSHRERVHSNLTRVVVVVWLFVVLILNSSYTANLSSILTVRRLKPTVTDIELLKRTKQKIGCDGDSFVRTYLEKVLKFESENILNVSREDKYRGEFESHNISAAFLELPYEKVFIGRFCKGYIATTPTYRFGGLGFVFQKGSPIAADFSKAILKLSENGELKTLEEQWFAPSSECLVNVTSNERTERLSLHSFSGVYWISGATSTLCFLTSVFQLLNNYRRAHQAETRGNIISKVRNFWSKVVGLAKNMYNRIKQRQIFPSQP